MNGNIAARAGRWSAAHWKTVTFAWLAFAVLAVIAGTLVGTNKIKDVDTASGDTKKAEQILATANFKRPATESILVRSKTATVHDAAFGAAVNDVVDSLRSKPDVRAVRSPLDRANAGQISRNGHAALVEFDMKGDIADAQDKVQPFLDSTAALQKEHPGFTIGEFGFASANHVLAKTLGKDFQRAELSSVPVTLVILLFAFGALVAAGLPVLLAFSGVLATIGLSSLASHLFAAGDATQSVILLIGMAVGVDYSLFYLRREREERAAGAGHLEALLRTAATSGYAVFISGLTVMIAMAGMLFTGNPIFTSIAVGAMLMVAVALIGSLSILPALLSKLGDRVNKGRLPLLGRRKPGESKLWNTVLDAVLKRPVLSAVLSGGALFLLALPALNLHTQLPSFTDLPKSIAIVRTYDAIQKDFPGAQTPADVVVKARDVTAPNVRHAIASLEQQALASGEVKQPVHVEVNPDRTVAIVSLPLQGDGNNAASVHALQTLRGNLIPNTVGAVPGAVAYVTGETAGTHDFNQQMKSHAPIVFGFVLALCFLLLLRHVPLDRDPDQGRAAQPAVGRRRVRAARARLPAHVGAGPALVPLERRDRFLAAAVHVRDPVRTVDGLPRVHPQPGQGARRRRHADGRGGRDGDQAHGVDGDERGDRHGRGVRDLRHAARDRHQADGLRPRGGDPDRRDGRPCRAAPVGDEAARRMELVPAALARVAARPHARADCARRDARARRLRAPCRPQCSPRQ